MFLMCDIYLAVLLDALKVCEYKTVFSKYIITRSSAVAVMADRTACSSAIG